jgi:hypothetical protein
MKKYAGVLIMLVVIIVTGIVMLSLFADLNDGAVSQMRQAACAHFNETDVGLDGAVRQYFGSNEMGDYPLHFGPKIIKWQTRSDQRVAFTLVLTDTQGVRVDFYDRHGSADFRKWQLLATQFPTQTTEEIVPDKNTNVASLEIVVCTDPEIRPLSVSDSLNSRVFTIPFAILAIIALISVWPKKGRKVENLQK